MEVHLFAATSSPSCSGFALWKTAEDNKEDSEEEVVNTVEKFLCKRLSQISKVC